MTRSSGSKGSRFAPLAVLVLGALIAWAHLRLPLPAAGSEVDASWQQALGQALVSRLRFGHDIWFTHGPLGYFVYGRYEPALFEAKLFGWELAFKGLCAGFVAAAILRIRGRLERLVAVLVVLLLDGGDDAHAVVVTLSIAAVCLDARGATDGGLRSRLRVLVVTGLGLACLALLALAKFTWLLFAVASVCAIAARLGARSPLGGLAAALAFAAAFALAWLGAGQELSDVAPYLVSSLRVAAGYSEAMSLAGPRVEVELALAALALTLAAVLLRLHRTRSLYDAAFGAVVAAGLFLAWKSGFTRHLHEANRFFGCAALAPLLLAARAPREAAARPRPQVELAAVTLAVLAGVGGFALALDDNARSGRITNPAERLATLRACLDPRELETSLVVERARLRERHALPRIRAEVGTAPVDLFGSAQGTLFLNELRWRPRPVFQSYYAYTPELMEANAAFLASARAPRYVIVTGGRIDRRYPESADAAATLELLRGFEPLFWEKGHLLLRRRLVEPRAAERATVQRTSVRFGEQIELFVPQDPGALFLLRLELRPTTYGRLAAALFSAPELVLHALLSDGATKRFRLVPGPFRHGVPAAPLFETDSVWNEWYLGEPPLAVRALWIEADRRAARCFEADALLELVRVTFDATRGEGVPQVLTVPSFFPQPKRIVSRRPVRRRSIAGRPALIVNAPSKLTYELAPGAYRLRGRFGFAERDDGALPGEAARFAAALRPATGGGSIVLERTLVRPPGDTTTPVVPFDVPFQIAGSDGTAELVLLTAAAEGRPGDGAYWCDVTIERAESEPPR